MLFTHKRKGEATEIVRQAWNIIRTRFNAKVVFMRSDGEPALGDDFQEIVRETGITFAPSAPDSPDQTAIQNERVGF